MKTPPRCRDCGTEIPYTPGVGRRPMYCLGKCRDEGPDLPLDGLTDVDRYRLRARRILKAYADGVEAAVINDEYGDKAIENARRALKRGAA